MSILMNLSLNEGAIKAFFEGDDSYWPESELVYIHTHPLVKPNFLDEINQGLKETGLLMVENNVTGQPLRMLAASVTKLGEYMGSTVITLENAKPVLEILRSIHEINLEVKETYGGKK